MVKKLIHAGALQWKLEPHHKEQVKDRVSKTIPDDSYTIRELLQKFSTGSPLPVGKTPVFMSDAAEVHHDMEDAEKVQKMELFDMSQVAELHQQNLKEKRSAMDEAGRKMKEKHDAELKALREKEFSEFTKKHSPASDKLKGADDPKV